jgi:hypothetical protein
MANVKGVGSLFCQQKSTGERIGCMIPLTRISLWSSEFRRWMKKPKHDPGSYAILSGQKSETDAWWSPVVTT